MKPDADGARGQRSFDLNYENNILLADEAATAAMRARQVAYLRHGRAVTLADVRGWSVPRRLWNNALAIAGPVL